MLAAPAAQKRLLDLQRLDTAISQLEHRRRALPELAEIAAAQKVRARMGEEIVANRTQVSDLELEVAKAESDLVPVRERKVRDQKRVDDGSVSDPKQLNALLAEIQHLATRINDLEDVELDAMERLEAATATRDALAARRADGDTQLRRLLATRDEQFAEIDAELAQLTAQRAGVAGELPAELVALYDRIRPRAGGLGAAALVQRRCSGCRLDITANDLDRYRAAGPDEVLRCEECDRILVRGAESGL